MGTVRDVLDASGAIANQLTYDTYGRILSQSNPAFGDRFAFTGREWDEAAQLYYYRARFYDPVNGRFLSQDPIRFAAGDTNLYRYVSNNPLDFTDPSGNVAMTECLIVRFASAALNAQCSAVQLLLKGEFKGKTFAEAGAMTMSRAVFGGELRTTDTNGNPLSGGEMLAQNTEQIMHLMSVASTILPGGSGFAMQLMVKAISISTTAQAVAGLVSNPHVFEVMSLAETWVRGAYAVVQDPHATFYEAVDAFNEMSDVQEALLWSEIVCGAANLGLMVMNANARCFVAGTPIVVAMVPRLPADPTESKEETMARYGITNLDVVAGAAIAGAILIRRKRKKKEEAEMHERDLLFSKYGDDDEPHDGWDMDSELDELPVTTHISRASTAVFSKSQSTLARSPGSQVYASTHPKASVSEPRIMKLVKDGEASASHGAKGSQPRPVEPQVDCVPESARVRRGRGWLSSLALFGCLTVALLSATPRLLTLIGAEEAVASSSSGVESPSLAPRLVTKPIEAIRCGDRIPSELPAGLLPRRRTGTCPSDMAFSRTRS